MPPHARTYSVKPMANDLTPHKDDTTPVKRRVSAAVREALNTRVREGKKWDDCAKAAGLSPSGLYKARKQQHVQILYEELKAQYIQDVEALKALHKPRAFEVARQLMDSAKSEAVKMRAVEFFAGERKGNAVNVAVSVNNHAASGYDYVPPGAQVIDITPQQPADDSTPDSPSSGEGDEAP